MQSKDPNVLVEDAVMLLRGVIRTTKCHVESCTQEELREDSPNLAGGWWNMRGASCPGARRDEMVGPHLKYCMARSQHKKVYSLARPISSESLNRMNPRYKFGVWLGVRNNNAECFVGTAEGLF